MQDQATTTSTKRELDIKDPAVAQSAAISLRAQGQPWSRRYTHARNVGFAFTASAAGVMTTAAYFVYMGWEDGRLNEGLGIGVMLAVFALPFFIWGLGPLLNGFEVVVRPDGLLLTQGPFPKTKTWHVPWKDYVPPRVKVFESGRSGLEHHAVVFDVPGEDAPIAVNGRIFHREDAQAIVDEIDQAVRAQMPTDDA